MFCIMKTVIIKYKYNRIMKVCIYFYCVTILVTFDFSRNLMSYFDHLYIELYTFKNYKKLIF